ncbi:MAG: NAD(P)/FAD-dependent oxidoreductase [Aridibacter sp.]
MKFDAIIIGAGAAGIFCAIEAGKRGRKVLLIEHNSQIGRKIIISGGGRCNFTNLDVRSENFISNNPHFSKSALARYTSIDFINLVKKHKIKFYEKKLGQLFCRERSQQIVEMLLSECEKANVKILTDTSVKKVCKKEYFEIETNNEIFKCENLVIATGGFSFPKIGATDFGYKIAEQFNIKITKIRPSLVPLTFANGQNFSKLAGISVDSTAEFKKQAFRENILFTHRGLSGPAVLQISNYWQENKPVKFNLLPDLDLFNLLEENRTSKQTLINFLGKFLPNRFAETFTNQNFQNKPLNQLSNKEMLKIADFINNWQVLFNETEGWHKAEVTLGGIDTNEISSQTMESKKVEGLYFIGEVLDVTGWLGGYNFQWAWSSGFAAGQII